MKTFTVTRAGTVVAVALCSITMLAPSAVSAPDAPVPTPAAGPSTTVVARGLAAPKYPTLGPGGLYVPESGTGGTHCVRGVANTTVTRVCAGATGALVRIDDGHVHVLDNGLASASVASTQAVSGPTSVAFVGGRTAVLFNDGGVGPTGVSAVADPYGGRLGKLDLADRRGDRLRKVADIAAFQATHPQPPATLGGLPGETLYDSDPHDMAAYRGGYAVVDAGANDVVWVHGSGRTTLLARLATRAETAPPGALGPDSPATTIQAQAVPSSVTVGPDGALYVGLLRGAPALPGTAEVDRVVPGRAPQPVVTGLTRVTDLAFDPQGRLDILESDTGGGGVGGSSTGALLRATVHGTHPTTATDLGVRGLRSPVGLAIAATGTAYVTADSTTAGHGTVLAVTGLG